MSLTPDDDIPDLEKRLAELQALGPMEFEPGEVEAIAAALDEMNRLSKQQMENLASQP